MIWAHTSYLQVPVPLHISFMTSSVSHKQRPIDLNEPEKWKKNMPVINVARLAKVPEDTVISIFIYLLLWGKLKGNLPSP